MIREEAEKVNEIDKIIFEELQNKLKIKKDNVNILNQEELEKNFNKIEEKKK